jgi:hypothetical protein
LSDFEIWVEVQDRNLYRLNNRRESLLFAHHVGKQALVHFVHVPTTFGTNNVETSAREQKYGPLLRTEEAGWEMAQIVAGGELQQAVLLLLLYSVN